jgi:hypothetical protein
LSWVEEHLRRRNAARDYLAAIGMTPQRNRDEANPMWRVPHWNGLFGDHDLIDLARHYGFQPDRAADPVSPAARGANPTAPGAGANCPNSRSGALSFSEVAHG